MADVTVIDASEPVTRRAYELGRRAARLEAARSGTLAGPGGLVAAAQTIDLTSAGAAAAARRLRQASEWQQDAWLYFDVLDIIKEAARFMGRSLSKVQLYPAVTLPGSVTPVPVDTTVDGRPVVSERDAAAMHAALDRLGGSGTTGGHASMLERWGVNSFVVGEAYLVGYVDEDGGEQFVVASVDELRVVDDRWVLQSTPDARHDELVWLPDDSLVVRVWYQHARYAAMPDSPVAGVLDHCEQLVQLQNEAMGTSLSRMNNGVLLVPKTSLGAQVVPADGSAGEGHAALTLDSLQEHIVTGVRSPRSAAVAAPIVIAVDPEDVDRWKHLTFERAWDQLSDDRIAALIHRIATGVDLTTEVLTGRLNESNHWSLWALTDQQFAWYVEPTLLTFLDAVVRGYYRPALLAAGVAAPVVAAATIGYDASLLVRDPDITDTTFRAHDAGLLADAAARARLGISEAEAASEEELARRAQRRAAERWATVEPPGADAEPESGGDSGPAVTASAAGNQQAVRLGEVWAERDRLLRARLTVAADAALVRALDRAGARLRSRFSSKASAWRDVIDGASNRRVASLLGPGAVTAAGVDPDELLSGEFDELLVRARSMIGRAQAVTRSELVRVGMDADMEEEMEAKQTEDRDRGVLLLGVLVAALAARRLFDPDPKAAAGEVDPDVSVPAGLAREVLSVAGGAQGRATAGGAVRSLVDDSIGGLLATGQTVVGFAERLGFTVEGWRWAYGDAGTRLSPFPPHELLDGVEFTAWDDPRLANTDAWPDEPFWFPGDHEGCQCDAVPILTRPDENPA